MTAIVSLGCIVHQHCLNRYDFNLCLKTGKLREGSLKSSGSLFQRVGPEVAKLRGPISLFLFSAQEDRRRAKAGEGRNSWFQYKHLREVCRSDTKETLVDKKTQLEVDSWTDGPMQTITNVSRDWVELALPEDQAGRHSHHSLQWID